MTREYQRWSARVLLAASAIACISLRAADPEVNVGDLPPTAVNDQKASDKTISPLESLARIKVPAGFNVTLFAGEPNVAQPIAATFDDRGRLWVAECYSHPRWRETGRDRIVIFEDTDNDGQFDRRKVFWDQGRYLTGLAFGHGGVWICNTPSLMFIPDRDGDDVPDGPPEEHLNGWVRKNPHNVLNNLIWGPDGWLYGCIGNAATSRVGPPDASDEERVSIARGIWRYDTVNHKFEVVGQGAVNPWGLDFNDWGEGFFTNCVLGHLWHLIPGAYYERRPGERDNPYAYSRIPPIADHLHWGGGAWTSSRGGKGAHSIAGGGHAHTGAMIYLGDQWPAKYRNTFFTGNLHGNRLNNDRLEREGAGYVGRHSEDFLMGNHDWFRCLWQKYGPDGGVVIGDWHDYGECHDNDGSHRTSGRIYKIAYGDPKPLPAFDLAKQSDEQLVALQLQENDWYVRHARRLLHERSLAGQDMSSVNQQLSQTLQEHDDVTRRLRALWALNLTDGLDKAKLVTLLEDKDEHVRAWAVRLSVDRRSPDEQTLAKFAELAGKDSSPLVRLYLAAALQRLPIDSRWEIAAGLVSHGEDVDDHSLPHMIWYGIEPLVAADAKRATMLLVKTKIPLIRKHIARRIAELN